MAGVDETAAHGDAVRSEAENALHSAVSASRIVLNVPGVGGALDWSPNGRVFVTEGVEETGIVDIRDAETGESVHSFKGHEIDINDVGFSGDGSRLVTAGDDGAARVWDPATGALVREVVDPAGGAVWGPSLSPDGSMVAASWPDEADRVRIVDVESGRTVFDLVPAGAVETTAFDPTGRRAVLGRGERVVPGWSISPRVTSCSSSTPTCPRSERRSGVPTGAGSPPPRARAHRSLMRRRAGRVSPSRDTRLR